MAPQKDDPSFREEVSEEVFFGVLDAAIAAVEAAGIPYALMGGIASAAQGRHRFTHDIDFFVLPEQARPTLAALQAAGFEIEETDPDWLFKAFRDDVLVDVIFSAKGEILFDEEVQAHVRIVDFRGRRLRVVSAEDLIVMKAIVHQEHTPRHWHDALGILACCPLDWDYVLRRARFGRRRVLSLLIYAQTNGLDVPDAPIRSLFGTIYEPGTERAPVSQDLVARVREALAADGRVSELDVHATVAGGKVFLTGAVSTPERREAVTAVASETLPDHEVQNLMEVMDLGEKGAAVRR